MLTFKQKLILTGLVVLFAAMVFYVVTRSI